MAGHGVGDVLRVGRHRLIAGSDRIVFETSQDAMCVRRLIKPCSSHTLYGVFHLKILNSNIFHWERMGTELFQRRTTAVLV